MSNHQNEEKQVGVDEEDEEEKWVKHYSSNHQILLVGEGDFSFSLSLANSFGSASNILASSLDPYNVLIKKYKEAKSNLENLEKLGASLLHGVDATKMKLHSDLRWRKFDRIIFNFPHAGFHGKEDHAHVVKMHRNLVHGFFHNAIVMLRADGEIHVNHKATAPFCHWNITELGLNNCLVLIECVDFKKEDYPGYHNKRGDGWRCDEPFPLGECSTFKFRLSPTAKRLHTGITSMVALMHERPPQFRRIPMQMQQWSSSIKFSSQAGHLTNMEQTSQHVSFPLTSSTGNSFSGMNDGHLINPTVTFGGTNHDLRHSFHTPRPDIQGNPIQMQQWRMTDGHSYHAPRPNFVRDFAAMPGRTLNGDMYALHEHHHISMRLRRLKRLLGYDHQLNESDEQQLEYR
ncbi:hypothetical protein ACB092_11G058600 [Castanea dentata]